MRGNMNDYVPAIKAPLIGLVAAGLNLLGGWDVPLQTLAILNVADVISGVAKSILMGTIQSDLCARGILKKIVMWLFVVVAVALDALVTNYLGQDSHLRSVVVVGWCITETISVMENGRAMGLDVPPVITDALERLRKAAGLNRET